MVDDGGGMYVSKEDSVSRRTTKMNLNKIEKENILEYVRKERKRKKVTEF